MEHLEEGTGQSAGIRWALQVQREAGVKLRGTLTVRRAESFLCQNCVGTTLVISGPCEVRRGLGLFLRAGVGGFGATAGGASQEHREEPL